MRESRKKNGLKAKLLKALLSVVSVVRAEEPPVTGQDPTPLQQVTMGGPTTTPVSPQTTVPLINYEQLIAQARQEEKNKLYPRISQLEGEVKMYTQKINELLLENGTLKARIQELEGSGNVGTKELQDEIARLKGELDKVVSEDVLRAEIEKEFKQKYELDSYKAKKIEELKAQGIGVLPDLVTGSTVEEIDASLEPAKQAFANLLSSYNISFGNAPTQTLQQGSVNTITQGNTTQVQSSLQQAFNAGANQQSTQLPPSNPPVGTQSNTVTRDALIQEFTRVPVGSPRYMEIRSQLGIK